MLKSVYDINNNGVVDKAETVNGYTVEVNVPANAKFTDTIYNDTEIKKSINLLQTDLSGKVDKIDGKSLSTNDFTNTLKSKLDGIENNANYYTLPTASSTIKGGVLIGSNINLDSGKISITKSNVIDALGYTPPTTNTTYTFTNGLSASGTTVSNSGVRSISTGTSNGTISVNTNGTSINVTVKGLGSLAYKSSLSASDVGAIPTSAKGVANGVATLDASGLIPTSQLPSYVDDVVEYAKKADFPATGQTGKIYVDKTTNLSWRWGGSSYVEISPSLALGTTSSTAFRGDYGNTAYTHAVTNKGSAFSSGLYKITTNSAGHVTAATAVTKADITALGIPSSNTTYSAGDGLALSSNVFKLGKRWVASIKGKTWSRIFNVTSKLSSAGWSGIICVAATRNSVVFNSVFAISASHPAIASIIQLSATPYSNSDLHLQVRYVAESVGGSGYFELYDDANGIANTTTQGYTCLFIPLSELTFTAYTTFTDGTTIPSGYKEAAKIVYQGAKIVGTTTNAIKATQDSDGKQINTTYYKTASLGQTTFKVTRGTNMPTNTAGYWSAMCNTNQNTSTTLPSTGKWWHIISTDWTGTTTNNWLSQLALPTQDGGVPHYRRNNGSNTEINSSTWHKFITDENISSQSVASAAAASKITGTLTNPTAGTEYRIPFYSNNTTEQKDVRQNNGLGYLTLEGTTSAVGYGILQVGNTTATGTAGNKEGRIRIFSANTACTDLFATASTTYRAIYLPNDSGTIALTKNLNVVHSGTAAPAASLGKNGDVYIQY